MTTGFNARDGSRRRGYTNRKLTSRTPEERETEDEAGRMDRLEIQAALQEVEDRVLALENATSTVDAFAHVSLSSGSVEVLGASGLTASIAGTILLFSFSDLSPDRYTVSMDNQLAGTTTQYTPGPRDSVGFEVHAYTLAAAAAVDLSVGNHEVAVIVRTTG